MITFYSRSCWFIADLTSLFLQLLFLMIDVELINLSSIVPFTASNWSDLLSDSSSCTSSYLDWAHTLIPRLAGAFFKNFWLLCKKIPSFAANSTTLSLFYLFNTVSPTSSIFVIFNIFRKSNFLKSVHWFEVEFQVHWKTDKSPPYSTLLIIISLLISEQQNENKLKWFNSGLSKQLNEN